MNNKIKILVSGPTASGKTTIAYRLQQLLEKEFGHIEVVDDSHPDLVIKHLDECVQGVIEKDTEIVIETRNVFKRSISTISAIQEKLTQLEPIELPAEYVYKDDSDQPMCNDECPICELYGPPITK